MAAINAISRTTSERIKAIGFVSALMVVAIHCTAIPKGWWDGTVDVPKWIVALQALGTDTLARLAEQTLGGHKPPLCAPGARRKE